MTACKYRRKSVLINAAITAAFIIFHQLPALADKTVMANVNPPSTSSSRAIYCFDDAGATGWDQPAVKVNPNGTPSSTFSVSIPVKSGDIVEVMFSGCVQTKTYGRILLTSGNATLLAEQRYVSNCPDSGSKDHSWTPFTMKAIFQATKNCTLKFQPEYWRGSFPAPADNMSIGWCGYYAEAEIVQ